MRTLAATLLALFLIAAPASAYELDKADSRVPLPATDWRFLQQQCEDYDEVEFGKIACAYAAETDDMNGRSFDAEVNEPKGMGPGTYWHETGHLFDFTVLTDAHRAEFLRLVGRQGEEWWTDIPDDSDGIHNDYDPPGEWFADAYSICALRATGRRKLTGAESIPLVGRYYGRIDWPNVIISGNHYGYRVRWPVHQRICGMIGWAVGKHYDRRTGAYESR